MLTEEKASAYSFSNISVGKLSVLICATKVKTFLAGQHFILVCYFYCKKTAILPKLLLFGSSIASPICLKEPFKLSPSFTISLFFPDFSPFFLFFLLYFTFCDFLSISIFHLLFSFFLSRGNLPALRRLTVITDHITFL